MIEHPTRKFELPALFLTLALSVVSIALGGYIIVSRLHSATVVTNPTTATSRSDSVTYKTEFGESISLPSNIKRSDLDGYHLLIIEEDGVKRYAIQHCRDSSCNLFTSRWELNERSEAEKAFRDVTTDPPPIKIDQVVH